jgi:hypothetical protein
VCAVEFASRFERIIARIAQCGRAFGAEDFVTRVILNAVTRVDASAGRTRLVESNEPREHVIQNLARVSIGPRFDVRLNLGYQVF